MSPLVFGANSIRKPQPARFERPDAEDRYYRNYKAKPFLKSTAPTLSVLAGLFLSVALVLL
jgi:hypothetical protein